MYEHECVVVKASWCRGRVCSPALAPSSPAGELLAIRTAEDSRRWWTSVNIGVRVAWWGQQGVGWGWSLVVISRRRCRRCRHSGGGGVWCVVCGSR